MRAHLTVAGTVAPPVNTGAPSIAGADIVIGTTWTATPGTWTGATSTAGQWQRDSGGGYTNIAGATASTYQLTSADIGATVRYHETATNSGGTASANSNATSTVVSAISFVKAGGNDGSSVAATTASITVPTGGHAVGNLLLVAAYVGGGTVGISDTRGNTWVLDENSTNSTCLWRSVLTTALLAGDTITVTWTSSSSHCLASAEFTGQAASPLDQHTNKAGGTSTNISATTTGATTQPNELAIGVFGIGGNNTSWTPTGSYATLDRILAGSAIAMAWEYKILQATGTQQPTGSISPGHGYGALAATYKSIVTV